MKWKYKLFFRWLRQLPTHYSADNKLYEKSGLYPDALFSFVLTNCAISSEVNWSSSIDSNLLSCPKFEFVSADACASCATPSCLFPIEIGIAISLSEESDRFVGLCSALFRLYPYG